MLLELTCHMGSDTVTCHQAELTFPNFAIFCMHVPVAVLF